MCRPIKSARTSRSPWTAPVPRIDLLAPTCSDYVRLVLTGFDAIQTHASMVRDRNRAAVTQAARQPGSSPPFAAPVRAQSSHELWLANAFLRQQHELAISHPPLGDDVIGHVLEVTRGTP